LNAPLVSVSVPFTVAPALRVTPPELFTVKLLSTVETVGSSTPVVISDEPVYSTFALVLNVGASLIDPLLREMVALLPMVRLLPVVKVPLVSVSVPLTTVGPAKYGEVDPASIVRFRKKAALLILILPVVELPLPIRNVEFDVILTESFVIARSPPEPKLACIIFTVPSLIVKLFVLGT